MKNNNKTWFVAALLLVFAAGALGGALGGYNWTRKSVAAKAAAECEKHNRDKGQDWRGGPGGPGDHGPDKPDKEAFKKLFLTRINEELSLNEEQLEKAGVIFDKQHEQIMALRDDLKARFQSIEDDTVAQLRQILDQEQNKKMDQVIERYHSMRDAEGHGPPLFMMKEKDGKRHGKKDGHKGKNKGD